MTACSVLNACFGVESPPSAFRHIMHKTLKEDKGVQFYIDDVIIFGKSAEEHAHNLRQVLQCISGAGMKLNQKCIFNVTELNFLGHRISASGLSPLLSKVEAIIKAVVPTDSSQLQSFLGLAEYYSKFIP